MARSIFELVFRAVDQGAASAIAALQNALAGVQGVATHAGTAVQSSVSHIGTAVQGATSQTVSAVQHAATATSHAVQQAATSAGQAVQQTAAQAGQAAESMTARFVQLAASIGAMGFLKSATGEFAGFDDAMLRVQALSRATGSEFEALKARAAELGASTKFTAIEASEGMSQLAAAGYNTAQILDAIGPAMYAAAAGGSDLGETADQLTNIMGAFQLPASRSAEVADALTAGFTGAATTLDQLANAMVYCGPIANTLGYSLQDTTGILMAFADVGIKGEQAGTALRGGMARLIRPMKMARDVLEKYNIQLRDSTGAMRPFVDILDDISKAGLSAGEKIKLFGIEAGPPMMALLDKGTEALKKYQQQVKESGGRAKEVSDHMESGLGGALRRLDAAWSAFKNSFGEEFAPVMGALADSLAKLSGWFVGLPEWARNIAAWTLAFTALSAVLPAVIASFKLLFGFLGPGVQGLMAVRASVGVASAAIQGLAGACLAGKIALGGLVAAAVMGVIKIAEFAKVLWDCKRAADEEKAAEERLKKSQDELAKKYDAISQATGVTIKSHQDLAKAIKEGSLHYDEATQSWKKGADERREATEESVKGIKKLEGEALEELVEQYKKYADEIRGIQEQLAGRQKSLAAELRDMGRSGMSDREAWVDRKREAEEYVQAARRAADEARAAFASGDTISAAAKWKEAVAYADDARSAYKQLNTEVKDGDQVIISKADALKTAMDGVKQAGELGISILKEQQAETYKAMDALEGESGFAALYTHLDEAEQKWLEKWQNMSKAAEDTGKSAEEAGKQVYKVWQDAAGFWTNVDDAFSAGFSKSADNFTVAWNGAYTSFERAGKDAAAAVSKAIDQAAKDRTATIYVRHVEQRALGGLIGAAGAAMRQLASGGKLPGYGGGDKVSAMLEPGEFVVRKESVRHFGADFFETLNNLKLPDLSSLLPALPKPSLAAAGPASPTRTVNINLNVGGETYQMQTDERTAARLERWYALRSSNRLTRADFRG